jgi:hypothetical protein
LAGKARSPPLRVEHHEVLSLPEILYEVAKNSAAKQFLKINSFATREEPFRGLESATRQRSDKTGIRKVAEVKAATKAEF